MLATLHSLLLPCPPYLSRPPDSMRPTLASKYESMPPPARPPPWPCIGGSDESQEAALPAEGARECCMCDPRPLAAGPGPSMRYDASTSTSAAVGSGRVAGSQRRGTGMSAGTGKRFTAEERAGQRRGHGQGEALRAPSRRRACPPQCSAPPHRRGSPAALRQATGRGSRQTFSAAAARANSRMNEATGGTHLPPCPG